MFKKMAIAIMLLTGLLNAKYTVCRMRLPHDMSVICFNGEEYFSAGYFSRGGVTKTEHKCKCIKNKFGLEIVKRIK